MIKGYVEVENNLTVEKTELSVEELVSLFIELQCNRNNTIENMVKKNVDCLEEGYARI